MKDDSDRLPGGPIGVLGVTSQEGGNQRSSNRLALSSPGSAPASSLTAMPGEVDVHEPPEISAETHVPPVLIDLGGAKVNPDSADRSNSFSVPDGAGWNTGRDNATPLPEITPRSLLRRGQWNNL